jgi:hypothetical protein
MRKSRRKLRQLKAALIQYKQEKGELVEEGKSFRSREGHEEQIEKAVQERKSRYRE